MQSVSAEVNEPLALDLAYRPASSLACTLSGEPGWKVGASVGVKSTETQGSAVS